MKTQTKKARFLHQESREYRGLYRVHDYKARANRIERRTNKQKLNKGIEEEIMSGDQMKKTIREFKHGTLTIKVIKYSFIKEYHIETSNGEYTYTKMLPDEITALDYFEYHKNKILTEKV